MRLKKWKRACNARFTIGSDLTKCVCETQSQFVNGFDERLSLIEERINEIERGKSHAA